MKYLISCLALLLSCVPKTAKSINQTKNIEVEISYYWVAHPDDADLNSKRVPVRSKAGKLIAYAPEDLVKKISLEGSGYLPDGTLINIACQCAYPNARFIVLDKAKFPYGMNNRGKPLVPFKTVATDKRQIPMGTKLYIAGFDGVKLKNGSIHDGCFVASDVGEAIHQNRIDVFSGMRKNYLHVNRSLQYKKKFHVKLNPPNC